MTAPLPAGGGFMQGGGFMHGRGLGQRDEQDASEVGIAQAFEKFEHFLGLSAAGLTFQFALSGAGVL